MVMYGSRNPHGISSLHPRDLGEEKGQAEILDKGVSFPSVFVVLCARVFVFKYREGREIVDERGTCDCDMF